jgi:hypothetical protein
MKINCTRFRRTCIIYSFRKKNLLRELLRLKFISIQFFFVSLYALKFGVKFKVATYFSYRREP